MPKFFRQLGWLLLSAIIVLLDQGTKFAAEKYLVFQQPVMVIKRFFNFYLDYNRGAAFNFLSNQPGWQMWFFGLVALGISAGIVIYLLKHPTLSFFSSLGLALILGGALGNLIDRMRYQHVIDFISWHINNYYWPTFNIADSAVCIGVVVLLLTLGKGKDTQ